MQARNQRWRIPFRFSLRTLMLLVLVTGGTLGWFSLQRQREAHRKWVIATVQASNSSIDYDGLGISRILWFGGSANPASLPQKPLTGDEIEALGSCFRLRELMMISSVMTDEGLAVLSHDTMLESLYCFKPNITDAGVKHLANLTALKKLQLLRVPELTDASLAHIAGLSKLEEINLSGTSITGSGVAHLSGMPGLRSLMLSSSPLTDEGLANIAKLTTLSQLYFGWGNYTDAGIANLSKLANLTNLGFGPDACTEACLESLAGLKLDTLQIEGPQVSDLWLDRIGKMKSLHHVILLGAQVTDEAIAKLKASLPEAELYINGRTR
jgi:hypothetical protein